MITMTIQMIIRHRSPDNQHHPLHLQGNFLLLKHPQPLKLVLFGGLIGWRANKQSTVTTSTTEAELLSLAQGAKEGMFVKRLLNDLDVKFNEEHLRIHCDNKQTIRLITDNSPRLQTKLRHVDVHNLWIRQEVKEGRINVEYIPTKNMIANGLTKALDTGSPGPLLEPIPSDEGNRKPEK